MSEKRRPAKRPAPRTAHVALTAGDYAGWECDIRADFPAKVLADLQSGKVDRIVAALEVIVTSHNFPGEDGELAEHLEDVDPYSGLFAVATAAFEAISKLPNR